MTDATVAGPWGLVYPFPTSRVAASNTFRQGAGRRQWFALIQSRNAA